MDERASEQRVLVCGVCKFVAPTLKTPLYLSRLTHRSHDRLSAHTTKHDSHTPHTSLATPPPTLSSYLFSERPQRHALSSFGLTPL